jgi:hypothetical protein
LAIKPRESTMSDVTDKQQLRDPWTDPDPRPEDFEAWLDEHADELEWIEVPPNSTLVVMVPKGVSEEEWAERKAAARARGERLPEQTVAEEELAAAQAEEEKDWTPEQKAAREAERLAASEALEKHHNRFVRRAGGAL